MAPTLAELALAAAVEEGGAPVFDALAARLKTEGDPAARRRLLGALGRGTGPLVEKTRALAFDPSLKVTEASTLLWTQASVPENREGFWAWLQASWSEITTRLPPELMGRSPWMASGFCSETKAAEVEAFFEPRIASLPGAPRNLAGAVEAIRLCAALVERNQSEARPVEGAPASSERVEP